MSSKGMFFADPRSLENAHNSLHDNDLGGSQGVLFEGDSRGEYKPSTTINGFQIQSHVVLYGIEERIQLACNVGLDSWTLSGATPGSVVAHIRGISRSPLSLTISALLPIDGVLCEFIAMIIITAPALTVCRAADSLVWSVTRGLEFLFAIKAWFLLHALGYHERWLQMVRTG